MSDRPEPRGGWLERRLGPRSGLVAGIAGALIGAGGMALAQSQGLLVPHRGQVESVVHDYLLAHPEILREASQRLHDRDLAEAVNADRAAYETPYASAWAGDPKADVVLVEFFDYACPYCHRTVADVERLLAEDKKLKVVWREWPVLGDDSVAAAEASLVAARQGKFHAFYRALYADGRPTPDKIAAANQAAGVAPQPAVDGKAEISKNYDLARAIGASGTPVFVVGDQVLQGAVGYDKLKAAIAEARAKA